MSEMIGLDASIAYDESGVGGSTYSDLPIVTDVTWEDSKTTAEVKTRGQKFVKNVTGMRAVSLGLQILYRPTDTGFTALRTAYEDGTMIGIAVLDVPLTTAAAGDGMEFDGVVSAFGNPQPVDGDWMCDLTIVPSADADAVDPRSYTPSGV